MVIIAQVNGIQIGAILGYGRRQKNSNDSQNLMSYEIHKVNVIIDSVIWNVEPIYRLSKQNSIVQPVVTVCQTRPNRPGFIRNGPLIS